MTLWITLTLIGAVLVSFVASVWNYSVRDFSRPRLADYLETRGRGGLLELLVRNASDIVVATATIRLVANILILLALLRAFDELRSNWWAHYVWAAGLTVLITLFCSVALPHAIARHAAEPIVGMFAGLLLGVRVLFMPFAKLIHGVDRLVSRVAGGEVKPEPGQIEQEILSAVQEGEKEGIVD